MSEERRRGEETFDISDAHALLLGRIVAEWTMLELLLDGIIWSAANFEPVVGHLFTCRMEMQPKLEIIDGFVELKRTRPRLIEQWPDCRREINELREFRNAIVHNVWSPGPEPGVAIGLSRRRRKVTEKLYPVRAFTTEEMERALVRIETVWRRLAILDRDDEPPASPDRSP